VLISAQKTEKGWREVLIASNEVTPPAKPADATSSDVSPLDVTTPGFGGPSASNPAPSNERFKYVVAPQESADAALLGMISPRFKSLPSGSRMEVSAESHRIASALGRLLSPATGQGEERVDAGAALIVDYGTDRAASDSFRVSSFGRQPRTSY
jgi:NADH dehydrogenase [ubiquinone] 1 alpha subcomplex assembly factor 7